MTLTYEKALKIQNAEDEDYEDHYSKTMQTQRYNDELDLILQDYTCVQENIQLAIKEIMDGIADLSIQRQFLVRKTIRPLRASLEQLKEWGSQFLVKN